MTTTTGQAVPRTDSQLDVIVIGAGQSGLAIGRHLDRLGLRFLTVDAGPDVGHVWRSRWDSLTLFTAARYSGLPGLPFPGDPNHYPTKDETADYLHRFAETFDLPIRLNTRVTGVSFGPSGFRVQTLGETLYAQRVVVATGPFQRPVLPTVAGAIGPHIPQLHSAAYRNPGQLPAGPVLVVGGGNSGLQIAEELHRSRPVALSLGAATTSLPRRFLGRDLFWWLTTTGVLTAPHDSTLGARLRNRGELVIGTSARRLARAGVAVHDRVIDADTGGVRFADGSSMVPAAIVWATGYRSDYTWLDVPGALDESGKPVQHEGVSPVPGLYFLGLPWQHNRGSALLGFVDNDAAQLVEHIARYSASALANRTAPAR